MKEPIIAIWPEERFKKCDISQQYQYAISIREYEFRNKPIIRPDYIGHRINFYFDDSSPEHSNADVCAKKRDILELLMFSQKWSRVARMDPLFARMVIHCYAGISRSSACALMPLVLYFDDYQRAYEYLYEINPIAIPNVHIVSLIKKALGISYESLTSP